VEDGGRLKGWYSLEVDIGFDIIFDITIAQQQPSILVVAARVGNIVSLAGRCGPAGGGRLF
jgi:hypothetical protein